MSAYLLSRRCLKWRSGREGDLVARYGGEEFVVVLPGVSLAHATAIAERIQQKIREAGLPHAASAVASEVTVSIRGSSPPMARSR
ncbi:GGDEF domain-containing protein [Klebsiella pneumoniae subsp. pneumoniae]|nr:GGDEF domain-containing protein [Klebsiella pneumoniae subsp. pneumoniae]